MNPSDKVRAPRAMAWIKPRLGFDFSFTEKGRHKGTEDMLLTLWQQMYMERV